jgi:catechol 2,3-dioxygenase
MSATVAGRDQPEFVTVTIAHSGETCRYRRDESLLEGLRRLGKRGPPWSVAADRGFAPSRFDQALLGGVDVDAAIEILTKVLGFFVVETLVAEDGKTIVAAWLSCSTKTYDLALIRLPENGKLHHVSFWLNTWEQVLRAGDIMSMNGVSVDIGPTRHGVTRGATIYAFDRSGNRFETFSGGYAAYPDMQPITWTMDHLPEGLDYVQRKLHDSFLTVFS